MDEFTHLWSGTEKTKMGEKRSDREEWVEVCVRDDGVTEEEWEE